MPLKVKTTLMCKYSNSHFILVVVILEADRLTKDAQHALRRTMEKYSSNLRIILCCTSSSRVIGPIKSRCLVVRVPSPTDKELESVISSISVAENIPLSESLCRSVISISKGNIRRALLSYEAAVVK